MIIIINDGGYIVHYAKNENEKFYSSSSTGGCYVEEFIKKTLRKNVDYIEYYIPHTLHITSHEDVTKGWNMINGTYMETDYYTAPSFSGKTLIEINEYLARNGYELSRC